MAIIKPFLSPGSKGAIAKQLVARMPPHVHYCEPFAGSASCFWVKPPSESGREILIDTDPNIVNTYRFIKDGDLEWLARQNWKISHGGFARAKQSSKNTATQVYRFMYRRRASWAASEHKITRLKVGSSIPITLERLEQQRARLADTEILQGSAIDLMARLDLPGMFLFCDPPWPGFNPRNWSWTKQNMRDFIDALDKLTSAKFMWAEHPDIEKYFRIPATWSHELLPHTRSGSLTRLRRQKFYAKPKMAMEVIFTNYTL